jgi:hypothetical protein
MTDFKFIINIFFCTLLFIGCRSTKSGEQIVQSTAIINWKQPDTTRQFSTTTKILKSSIIPDSVFEMTQLEYLTISGMDCDYGDNTNCWMINQIPASIKNLQELKSLSLTLNSIKSIPIELTELKKLKAIDLTDNSGLSEIEPLTKLEGLEYLWLYGCGLTKLPNDIGNLKNLKQLGLVGNNLDKQE